MDKRVWTIVDRNKGRIIDFRVGNDNIENANLLMYNLLSNNNKLDLTKEEIKKEKKGKRKKGKRKKGKRKKGKRKKGKEEKEEKEGKEKKGKKEETKKEENKIITIDYLCTDGHHAYNVVANHVLFKDHIKHHIVSKKETCLVESFNSYLRDNLARLNRKQGLGD